MIDKLIRALFSPGLGVRCRRCNEPLHPQDAVGASEAICLPCRLDPGRAGPTV